MYIFEKLDLEIPAFDDKSFNGKNSKNSISTAEKRRKNLENRSFGNAEKNRGQVTIHDRLVDLYLDWKEEVKNVDEPFIKCNYIEELVKNEELNLKYISLAIYPCKQCFFSINDQFNEPLVTCSSLGEKHLQVFRDSIDRGEIPAIFGDEKFQIPLYDHHLIINITKFSSHDNSRPLVSMFLLLKPTNSICSELIALKTKEQSKEKKVQNDPNSPDQMEDPEQYKKAIFELAKPLYFDLKSDKPLRLVLLLEFYKSPFASNTLKHFYNKRKIPPEELKYPVVFERRVPTLKTAELYGIKFVTDFFSESEENHQRGGSPPTLSRAEKRKKLLGTQKIVLQPLDVLEENLGSILRQRDVYQDPESDSPPLPDQEQIEFRRKLEKRGMNYHNLPKRLPPPALVETFQFITEYGDTEIQAPQMDILWGKGSYYSIIRVEGYVYRNEQEAAKWDKRGSRLELDKYLLSYAKLASAKFTQFMVIRHKPMHEDDFKIIFACGCLEDMEDNSAQSNNSQNKGQTENMDTAQSGQSESWRNESRME